MCIRDRYRVLNAMVISSPSYVPSMCSVSSPTSCRMTLSSIPPSCRLRRTGIWSSAALVAEDHIPVRLNLHEGGIELSVIRQEVGEETEHIEGTYEGEDMTIAFNTRYLTEGVGAVSYT